MPQETAVHLNFEAVVRELRKRDFAVLSTVSEDGRPHSVGVNYGISLPGEPFAIYLMTRRHLKKARNIARNLNMSLVVPLTRRLLWFLPPPSINFQGRAEILDWEDAAGTRTFESFFMGRQILKRYRAAYSRGETRICFVRISDRMSRSRLTWSATRCGRSASEWNLARRS